jgi:hypothetical protein
MVGLKTIKARAFIENKIFLYSECGKIQNRTQTFFKMGWRQKPAV